MSPERLSESINQDWVSKSRCINFCLILRQDELVIKRIGKFVHHKNRTRQSMSGEKREWQCNIDQVRRSFVCRMVTIDDVPETLTSWPEVNRTLLMNFSRKLSRITQVFVSVLFFWNSHLISHSTKFSVSAFTINISPLSRACHGKSINMGIRWAAQAHSQAN